MNITQIKVREDLPTLLNALNLKSKGVEVGVQNGIFSKHLLTNWDGEKLYLVDSWRQIRTYQDIANLDPNGQLNCFANTFMNVYEFGVKAVIIRELSEPAGELFGDGSLDFVFLDADHSYDKVQRDLMVWGPKIKKGGIFCGHDYLEGFRIIEDTQVNFGVKKAVDEWATLHSKSVHVTKEAYPSWFVNI